MTSLVRQIFAILLALLTVAPFAYRAYRHGAFAPLLHGWRGLSRFAQSVALAFFIAVFAYGSSKQLGGMIGEGLRSITPALTTLCTNAFSAIAQLTGYSISSVATNETHDFTMPEGAQLAERIARRGAHNDGFWLFDAFTNGIASANPVWIQTDGTITVKSPAPGIPIEELALYTTYSNITVYAPLQSSYGFLPASRWNDHCQSRIWTAVTDSGTRVITWENALLDRDPATPVSFQAEFREDGDVIYSYSPTPPLPNSSTSIGLFRNGTAQLLHSSTPNSSNSLTTNDYPLTTVHWSYIGDLGDGTCDTDGDGLTDWQEIMQTHTDPRRADTDGDGLTDYDEVNGATDPNNPDSDNDGIPDGWSQGSYYAHRLFIAQPGDRAVTVRLDAPTPIGNRAVLRVGDLPLLLCETNSWTFAIPTGTVWNVELRTAGLPVRLSLEGGDGVFVDNGDNVFASCTTAYDAPPPPLRGGMEVGGSRGGGATIYAPCVFLYPTMQVVHRGQSALVTAHCIPDTPGLAERLNWTFDPEYMTGHVAVADDKLSATVTGLGEGWTSSVTLHAAVGANPPEGLAGTAIVTYCGGRDHMGVEVSQSPSNTVIDVPYPSCGHPLDDEEEYMIEAEAGRETATGWQHLAWIDTDPSTPGTQRRTHVSGGRHHSLEWDMKATSSAPLVDGTDSLVYDANTTFARALPAVAAGQYVPPPFATVKGRILDANGNVVEEQSSTVAIPQYVQITWDAAVLEEFRQPIVFDYPGANTLPPTNVTIFAGCTAQEAASAFADIAAKVQAIFPPSANIVVVGPDANVPQPHKTIVIQTGRYTNPATGRYTSALGRTPNEHCHQRNDSPLGAAYVYDGTIRESLPEQYRSFYLDTGGSVNPTNDWRNVPLPLSADLISDYIAQVALHECCHSMGLVPTASAKYNGHNNCTCGIHYMDRGKDKYALMRLGLIPQYTQRWKTNNTFYLEFVFPNAP